MAHGITPNLVHGIVGPIVVEDELQRNGIRHIFIIMTMMLANSLSCSAAGSPPDPLHQRLILGQITGQIAESTSRKTLRPTTSWVSSLWKHAQLSWDMRARYIVQIFPCNHRVDWPLPRPERMTSTSSGCNLLSHPHEVGLRPNRTNHFIQRGALRRVTGSGLSITTRVTQQFESPTSISLDDLHLINLQILPHQTISKQHAIFYSMLYAIKMQKPHCCLAPWQWGNHHINQFNCSFQNGEFDNLRLSCYGQDEF